MESHNHPSYIDPYEGAATGIGGAVRDILSMGTKPIAISTCLYLGMINGKKNQWLLKNIIKGSSNYSQVINVAVVQNDIYFNKCYNGNPLVNVIAIGVGNKNDIVTSVAKKIDNRLILYGAKTNASGIDGASFSSKTISFTTFEFKNNVPKGDPEIENKLISATLEAVNKKLIKSCRDLGAAGLVGATAELAEKGGFGAIIDLTNVKSNQKDISLYEIMLSESQERMLAEIKPEDMSQFKEIMTKYNLCCIDVGYLIKEDQYIVYCNNKIEAQVPLSFLVNGVCKIKLKTKKPKNLYYISEIEKFYKSVEDKINKEELEEVNFKKLYLQFLSSYNMAPKNWILEQYKNTINEYVYYIKDDVSILKITDFEGLAITCGCEPYISSFDPYYGSQVSLLKNILKLIIKGSSCLCIVNNLNFGNPNSLEQYWYLEQSILGISSISKKLNIPVVGGNVSLYNESKEFDNVILPTASLGIIGKVDLSTSIPNSNFIKENDYIYLIGELSYIINHEQYKNNKQQNSIKYKIPKNYKDSIEIINVLFKSNLITASRVVSRGGFGIALSYMTLNYGANIDFSNFNFTLKEKINNILFFESPFLIIISTTNPEALEKKLSGIQYLKIGETIKDKHIFLKF